jgi:hypothetical protein
LRNDAQHHTALAGRRNFSEPFAGLIVEQLDGRAFLQAHDVGQIMRLPAFDAHIGAIGKTGLNKEAGCGLGWPGRCRGHKSG